MLSIRLKAARKALKLTQEELAVKVNTTKGTISNYENGHSTPSNEMLVLLAEILNTTPNYLLGVTEYKEPSPYNEEVNNQDFEAWVNDPRSNIFFKEFNESSEEQKEALLKVWEILKNQGKL